MLLTRLNFARVFATIAAALTAGALPGFAQDGGTSHLVIATLDGGTGFRGPASINFGGTGDYTVVITNTGPNDATGVTMDALLPIIASGQLPNVDGGAPKVRVTATSTNCARVNPDPNASPLPCTLPVINEFTSVTATFTVQLPLPAKPYTFPCPVPFTMGSTTVIVTGANDTNPDGGISLNVNSSGAVRPFADIRATLSGPPTAHEGDTVTYQASVSNLGPCPSNDVVVTSGAAGDIIFGGNTGDCTTAFPCALGIIASGTTKNFTSTYMIDKLPDPLRSTGDPNSISANSAATPLPDGGTLRLATFDPDTTNNSASTQTVVSRSAGCSLSQASLGSLPLLLALLGLTLRRRHRRSN